MQKLFLVFLLQLSVSVCYGQHTREFAFEETNVTLSCLYDNVKVIDKRTDNDCIGHVRTGALNRMAKVVTDKPLNEYLSDYFSRLLESNTKSELVVLLYDFRIEEGMIEEEIGSIHFDLDFYAASDGRYCFLGNVDSLYEVKSSVDVTQKLLNTAQHLFKTTVTEFAIIDTTGKSAVAYNKLEIHDRRRIEREKYPIYKVASFKNGLYKTKTDFLNNTPLDTGLMYSTVTTGHTFTYTIHYLNERGKRGETLKASDFFAVYCNDKWFAGRGDVAEKMVYKDGDFYATKTFRGLAKGVNPMGGAMGLGAVGGAIFFSIAEVSFGDNVGNSVGTSKVRYESKFSPAYLKFKPIRRINSFK